MLEDHLQYFIRIFRLFSPLPLTSTSLCRISILQCVSDCVLELLIVQANLQLVPVMIQLLKHWEYRQDRPQPAFLSTSFF